MGFAIRIPSAVISGAQFGCITFPKLDHPLEMCSVYWIELRESGYTCSNGFLVSSEDIYHWDYFPSSCYKLKIVELLALNPRSS